jgi:type IV pilus assembly protein PilA
MTNTFLQTALRRTKAKKQNGFTLIELMVVIAIVGVLSAVGLPELLKAQNSAKDSAALQETVAAAKTCSIDVLTGGTAYDEAIAAGTWEYITAESECDTAETETIILGAGPGKTYSITLTDGVPAKPEVGTVTAPPGGTT